MQMKCDVCDCDEVLEPGFTGETHCPDCGAVYEYDEGPRLTRIPWKLADLKQRVEELERWREDQQNYEREQNELR